MIVCLHLVLDPEWLHGLQKALRCTASTNIFVQQFLVNMNLFHPLLGTPMLCSGPDNNHLRTILEPGKQDKLHTHNLNMTNLQLPDVVPALAAGLSLQPDIFYGDALIDCFAHVVHSECSHRSSCHSFHFNTCIQHRGQNLCLRSPAALPA